MKPQMLEQHVDVSYVLQLLAFGLQLLRTVYGDDGCSLYIATLSQGL